jgi:O-antigen/teichoic acid export membrane protein
MGFFTIVYFRSATILIKALTDSDQLVGFYNAGFRLVEAFMLFPSVVVAPMYSVFARVESQERKVVELISDSSRLIFVISSVICIPIFVFPDEFTSLLFGKEYAPASACIGLVVLSIIPVGLTWVFGSLVAACGRQKRANKFILLATVLNITMNFLLIPILSIEGAALTTLLTECIIALSNVWVVRDFLSGSGIALLLGKMLFVITGVTILAKGGILFGPFYFKFFQLVAAILLGFLFARAISSSDVKKLLKFI